MNGEQKSLSQQAVENGETWRYSDPEIAQHLSTLDDEDFKGAAPEEQLNYVRQMRQSYDPMSKGSLRTPENLRPDLERYVDVTAQEHGVDPSVIKEMIKQESNWDWRAT